MARTSNRHFFAPVVLGRRLAAVAASGALATGVLLLASPTADAAPATIKESTIKSECAQAGGSYGTSVRGGVRLSACSYPDNEGNMNIDHYKNGVYTGSDPS